MTSIIRISKTAKSTLHHAHDLAFKSAMTDIRVAKDLLEHHLPADIKEKIDLDFLQLASGSFIDPELQALHTDILYSVKIKNTFDQKAYIYIHLEHLSKGDKLMPFRMIKYGVKIISNHLKNNFGTILPVIIPVVIYNGKSIYPYTLDVFDLFGENRALAQKYMFESFQLVDLNIIPDEEIRAHEWSCLLEMLFKHIRVRDIMSVLEKLTPVFHRMTIYPETHDYVITMIKYVVEKANIQDRPVFLKWVKKNLPRKLEEQAMTLAEQWKQEGREEVMQRTMTLAEQWKQEGREEIMQKTLTLAEQWKQEGREEIMQKTLTLAEQWKQEGREEIMQKTLTLAEQWKQEGRHQGEKYLLIKMLIKRFGRLSLDRYKETIEKASGDILFIWGERILEAKTIEEVFH